LLERGYELRSVADALRVGGVSRVCGELGRSDDVDEARELFVVAAGDDDRFVCAMQAFVGCDRRMRVAESLRCDASPEHGLALVGERALQAREQVELQVTAGAGALAGEEGRADASDGVFGDEHVNERDTHFLGLAVCGSGDAHETAECLHDEVVSEQRGPEARPEPRDGGVDEPRVGRAEGVVIEPDGCHHSRLEIFDDDIAACNQDRSPRDVGRVGEVEADGLFVAVDGLEVGRSGGRVRRTPCASVVAAFWPLDFDDPGTEVGECHGGERAGEHAAEVGDDDSAQRTGGCRGAGVRCHGASSGNFAAHVLDLMVTCRAANIAGTHDVSRFAEKLTASANHGAKKARAVASLLD